MLRIALNGLGRIGRTFVRALLERQLDRYVKLVAINDLGDPHTLTHLLQYDSCFGRLPHAVHLRGGQLSLGGQRIKWLRERDPWLLPWASMGIDLVIECSGTLKTREQAEHHLTAGAQRVLLSHPLDSADLTVVYGVNHDRLRAQQVVSNASCTTNCLAPLAMILHQSVGIAQGLVNTVHAYTNDQSLVDRVHDDLLRARAAALSMIPTSTGAAKTIGLVIPELAGRLDGLSVRVPTASVSLLDLTFRAERPTSREALHKALLAGMQQMPPGVMECTDVPLVSSDYRAHPASCVVDFNHTRVQGDLVKVLAWYDNEWAFANRLLDVMVTWQHLGRA